MRTVANNPTAKDVKELGVAVRTRRLAGGVSHSTGSVVCRHCGGYIGGLSKVADVIGVSTSTLSKWLQRGNVREDLARRIRASFARVEE